MKSTERFSDRVSNYLNYRPSYPDDLVDTLAQECQLSKQSTIADIGAGTGKLTELFLHREYPVTAIEPNKEMREAAESLFGVRQAFSSIGGDSESTRLTDNSVDLITAAQAFHWFDPVKTKREFLRILKPQGFIALIWNKRDTTLDFHKDYDALLTKYCPEYTKVHHHNISDQHIAEFCHPSAVQPFSFPYKQQFDLKGFLGRLFSSSYTPPAGIPEHEILTEAAVQLYQRYEKKGTLEFVYETQLYLAQVS